MRRSGRLSVPYFKSERLFFAALVVVTFRLVILFIVFVSGFQFLHYNYSVSIHLFHTLALTHAL